MHTSTLTFQGPTSHACNAPLRGGKFTFWEGGVKAVAFVSSLLIPSKLHGTKFNGMAHMTDVYATVAEGLAGLDLNSTTGIHTGPMPPDGLNLW
jgi:hypothetical protein